MAGEITITLNDDGTISIDATKATGSAREIRKELEALAADLGGTWTEEKHVPGAHHHHHDRDHVHN